MDLFLHIKITYQPKHNLHKVKEDLWNQCLATRELPTEDEFAADVKEAVDALPPLAKQTMERAFWYNDVQALIADKDNLYVMVANQEATLPVAEIVGWALEGWALEDFCNSDDLKRLKYWREIFRALHIKEYKNDEIMAAIKSACTH